jgi:thiosulfate/3-mercaptopyruvate sulfurtransferase
MLPVEHLEERRMFRLLIATLAVLAAAHAQNCSGRGSGESLVVSTGWLAGHLHDSKLVVLALGDRAEYDRAHIPGAVFLRFQDLSSRSSALTLELPPTQEIAETFAALGVGNDSRIVVYVGAGGRIIQASRALLTLDSIGLGGQSSLLDGGLAVWQSEGRPVTGEAPAIHRGAITPCPQSDVVVDNAYVASHLRQRGVKIVDARAAEFYTGQSASSGKRSGHIPGAVNLPFTTFVDAQGKLLPAATLRQMFQQAGVARGDRVVSYCHIGLQATMVYFAARYLGYDARLYDGSWEDWSAHKELPAETADHN